MLLFEFLQLSLLFLTFLPFTIIVGTFTEILVCEQGIPFPTEVWCRTGIDNNLVPHTYSSGLY